MCSIVGEEGLEVEQILGGGAAATWGQQGLAIACYGAKLAGVKEEGTRSRHEG